MGKLELIWWCLLGLSGGILMGLLILRVVKRGYSVLKENSSSVLQNWVEDLPFMQQSVLISAIRGPDSLPKDHISKVIIVWYRRCILFSAFDKCVLTDPYDKRGGSFTGPCKVPLEEAFDEYFRTIDELPPHFYTHLMHAAEILGYKHPDLTARDFWREFYKKSVSKFHLKPELEIDLDRRLGDNKENWLAAEEV